MVEHLKRVLVVDIKEKQWIRARGDDSTIIFLLPRNREVTSAEKRLFKDYLTEEMKLNVVGMKDQIMISIGGGTSAVRTATALEVRVSMDPESQPTTTTTSKCCVM